MGSRRDSTTCVDHVSHRSFRPCADDYGAPGSRSLHFPGLTGQNRDAAPKFCRPRGREPLLPERHPPFVCFDIVHGHSAHSAGSRMGAGQSKPTALDCGTENALPAMERPHFCSSWAQEGAVSVESICRGWGRGADPAPRGPAGQFLYTGSWLELLKA